MKNIVIFGAPGSGKGTQSDLMIESMASTTSQQVMFYATKSRTEQNLARQPRAL